MPSSTYGQLIDAYREFGQSDAFVNIHARFLSQVEPQPVGQTPYPGMVPPVQGGARPDMNQLSGGGTGGISEHLTPEFQEKLASGERTMEDFIRLREAATKQASPQPQAPATWIR